MDITITACVKNNLARARKISVGELKPLDLCPVGKPSIKLRAGLITYYLYTFDPGYKSRTYDENNNFNFLMKQTIL
jgi:hypothetical protein